MNPTPLLHAIILGYGQFQKTTQVCLDSLIPEAKALNVPVTVFDNGSYDNSLDYQKNYVTDHSYVNSLFSDHNLGFAGGMNQAVRSVSAQWLLLVGSDTIFTKNSLKYLCQAIQNANLDIGLIGPVTNNAGNAQKISFGTNDFSKINELIARTWSKPSGLTCPAYRLDFFCVAIRKSLWDQLNGLDLSYGRGYYEDFDFCMRAKTLGYQCLLIEDAFVFHAGSASFKIVKEQKDLIRKNKRLFLQKNPNAKLRHLRHENFLTIEYYLESLKKIKINSGEYRVITSRLNSFCHEIPRGLLKRMWWHFKIQRLNKRVREYLSF